ncbi:helix-turn-helix transcriptional regulator [Paenibacillus sp. DMB5]|uniref:helix-turn-helix domain-containing protein n=1 Tax=Paenibacillus sp. DMB5 TaxID=1780103 RepID=UPI00076D5C66|nr:helix-turn-helix transcriptional regulator [Paenibacillus sp. DMB5]KUP22366.1 hypothetical protein AWJ19_27490 [Paenibacillus sp. DMB5]
MEINRRIRKYIKDNGLTFTYVAKESGIGLKKLSRMMTGKQRVDTVDYEKICSALKLNPSYFLIKTLRK